MNQTYNTVSIAILLYLMLVIPISCVFDDTDTRDNNLMAQNLTRDIAENPEEDAILGQIIASAEGALEFEMISSEPIGALEVDPQMGTLLAAMPELFDYEERTVITGLVRALSGTDVIEVEVTFNLVDVEAPIEDFNRFTKNWETDKFSWNGEFANDLNHNCRLDDKMSLSGTGNYNFDGGELCGNEDNQQLRSGTWNLDENLNFIVFDQGTEKEIKVSIDFIQDGRLSLSTTWMGQLVSGEFIHQ